MTDTKANERTNGNENENRTVAGNDEQTKRKRKKKEREEVQVGGMGVSDTQTTRLDEPGVATTSKARTRRERKQSVRGKYYVSAKVKGEAMTSFVDTAADMSLAPPSWREYGECRKLSKPINIKSFDGESVQSLEEKIDLTMDFGTVVTTMTFYVCQVTTPIIGIDMLRDNRQK